MKLLPRNERGTVRKDEVVVLQSYGKAVRGRQPWLNVKAGAGGVLQLGVDSLIGENHAHRWDSARWMWDERVAVPTTSKRWGTHGRETKVRRTLKLLDNGNYADALALWGVTWSSRVAQVLAGTPLSMHDASLAERWAEHLNGELWSLAPWTLAAAAPAGKAIRLFTLAGQHHQRKMSLMLSRDTSGPRLDLDLTATNARLPFIQFKRFPEHDLARLGPVLPEAGRRRRGMAKER